MTRDGLLEQRQVLLATVAVYLALFLFWMVSPFSAGPVMTVSPAWAGDVEEALEPLYREGEDAYLKGEFHDALDAFFAVKEQSRSAKMMQAMYWNIARCYQRLGKGPYEVVYLKAFLATRPSEEDAGKAKKRLTALTGSGRTPQGVQDVPTPRKYDKGPGSSDFDEPGLDNPSKDDGKDIDNPPGFDEEPGIDDHGLDDSPGLDDQRGNGEEPGIDNRLDEDDSDPGY